MAFSCASCVSELRFSLLLFPARFNMAEAVSTSAPTNGSSPSAGSPSTEVYAIFGAEPEVQAYAMAKYSRSSLSMKESLKEISQQKAEKLDRKSTRLNSSHTVISYAVFCLKKKKII